MSKWEEKQKELQAALDVMTEKLGVLPFRVVLPEKSELERDLEDRIEARLLELGIPAHLHSELAQTLSTKYSQLMLKKPEVMERVADLPQDAIAAFFGARYLIHFLRCIGIEETPDTIRELTGDIITKYGLDDLGF